MVELELEAIVHNIEKLTDFVNEHLEKMGCSRKALTQIDIALDELFSNICHYAYNPGVGRVRVAIEELIEKNAVQITLEDEGIPFDPLSREDPDINVGIAERAIGGLGIFMVKRTMDDIFYEFRDGKNILTVTKSL